MKFKADNVDTIYILMLHSFYVNETMLFNHIKKHGISVVYVMLDEYAFSGKLTKKSEEMVNRCREYAVKRYDNQAYFDKLMKIGEEL